MATRRSAATDHENMEVGDQVRHHRWGVGSILFKSGTGESTKAIVVFPEHGQRKLLLKYAKLELVQDTEDADEDEFSVEESEDEGVEGAGDKGKGSKEGKAT